MKTWSVQCQQRDGLWFIICGNLLEHEARYWFSYYCRNEPANLRLWNRGIVVAERLTNGE